MQVIQEYVQFWIFMWNLKHLITWQKNQHLDEAVLGKEMGFEELVFSRIFRMQSEIVVLSSQ